MTSWEAGDSAYLSDARYPNFLFSLSAFSLVRFLVLDPRLASAAVVSSQPATPFLLLGCPTRYSMKLLRYSICMLYRIKWM
eukprot:6184147-Pleurochrysis_carterae.AAC.2